MANREIKFRFWSKYLNHFIIPDDSIFIGALKDKEITKLQYTGIEDKNGKDIYEGDILNEYDCSCGKPERKQNLLRTGRVEWMPFGWVDCAYALIYNDRTSRILQGDDEPHYEVIGNIYENPELLQEHDEIAQLN